MRKLVIEINPNLKGLGIFYKITYPSGSLEGLTVYDSFRRKHYDDKATVVMHEHDKTTQQYLDLITLLTEKEIPYRQRFNKKNNLVRVVMDITKPASDPDRLNGENGEFCSSHPGGEGNYSLGYMFELCEWLYYHNNMTYEEKEKHILNIEKQERKICKGMGIGYIPTWSKKLKMQYDI